MSPKRDKPGCAWSGGGGLVCLPSLGGPLSPLPQGSQEAAGGGAAPASSPESGRSTPGEKQSSGACAHRGRLPPSGLPPRKHPRVAPQRARSQRNGPRDPEASLPGINNTQGCDCGLHPGGVAPVGPFSERAVPGGHAGECAESTRCGPHERNGKERNKHFKIPALYPLLGLPVPRENFISCFQQGEAPWLLKQECARSSCPEADTNFEVKEMSKKPNHFVEGCDPQRFMTEFPWDFILKEICDSNMKGSITVKDVTVDITQEEWVLLDHSQQQLYLEVMLENVQNLLSVGLYPKKIRKI
ncbi:zinc finger protein 28 homolog isoform X5 [Monodelphis domestica]|uniref:zinc finger protein 28 homolog isoform X5 n=1 Tax=Monodelphis domestica TaxID=13616 RepID=UPI0024E1ECDB|nr:zinc finger protein 28 homolog isoform X5 [Monodelphis domestica]